MAHFDPCSVDEHTFDKDIKAIEKLRRHPSGETIISPMN